MYDTSTEWLAQIGYAAYAKSSGGKNFLGNPMPTWEDLPAAIKQHWFAAANEIAGEYELRGGIRHPLEHVQTFEPPDS